MKQYSRITTLLKDYGFQFKKQDAYYYSSRNNKIDVIEYSFSSKTMTGTIGADNTGSFSCFMTVKGKGLRVPMRAYNQKDACRFLEKQFIELGLTKVK